MLSVQPPAKSTRCAKTALDRFQGVAVLLQKSDVLDKKRADRTGIHSSGRVRGQVLRQTASSDVQMPGDLADTPLLDKLKAVNRVDRFVLQHRVWL